MVKKIRFFPRSEYGMWKDGSTIYKDEKGFYIKQWNQKKNMEVKRYLKGFKVSDGTKRLGGKKRKYKKTVKKK
jgi:hypothetical protein